eukprot:Platyproteum_vivax@DN12673_c0_g1_i5.p2
MLDEVSWLYCVFDGHGELGECASTLACETIRAAARQKVKSLGLWIDGDGAVQGIPDVEDMALWFHSAFSEAVNEMANDPSLYATSGSSASVALHLGNEVFLAHCGDSRVAIAEWTKQPSTQVPCWKISELTRDHRPHHPDEAGRLSAAGGLVQVTRTVLPSGKSLVVSRLGHPVTGLPGIAMSRSLGDLYARQFGLISDPEVTQFTLHSRARRWPPRTQEFSKVLLMASDGLWDFNSPVDLLHQTLQCSPSKAHETCESLALVARSRRIEQCPFLDDTSMLLVYL